MVSYVSKCEITCLITNVYYKVDVWIIIGKYVKHITFSILLNACYCNENRATFSTFLDMLRIDIYKCKQILNFENI